MGSAGSSRKSRHSNSGGGGWTAKTALPATQRLREYVAYPREAREQRRPVVSTEGSDSPEPGPASFVFGANAPDPIGDDVYASAYCHYPESDLHLMFPAFYHRQTSKIDVQLATSRDGKSALFTIRVMIWTTLPGVLRARPPSGSQPPRR